MSDAQKTLDALKRQCKEDESPADHARHAAKLEAAYAAFSDGSPSNPAHPGENDMTVAMVVEASTDAN